MKEDCPKCGMPPRAMSKCIRPTWECGSQEGGFTSLSCREIARLKSALKAIAGLESCFPEGKVSFEDAHDLYEGLNEAKEIAEGALEDGAE